MAAWIIIAMLIGMWLGLKIQSEFMIAADKSYDNMLETLEGIEELSMIIGNEYEKLNNTLESYKECFDIYGQAYNKLIDENIELKRRLKLKN